MKSPTILVCVVTLACNLLLMGCNKLADSSTPPSGRQCTIQFRRNVLGVAANLPVPPTTDSINGADTSISGTLKSTGDEWVVLDSGGKEIWVPKAVILLIKF